MSGEWQIIRYYIFTTARPFNGPLFIGSPTLLIRRSPDLLGEASISQRRTRIRATPPDETPFPFLFTSASLHGRRQKLNDRLKRM